MNPFTVDICILASGLYVRDINWTQGHSWRKGEGLDIRDMMPIGACVAIDARSDTMRTMAATGVYFAYVVLFGLLATDRHCVLADALLVELRPLRESFFELPCFAQATVVTYNISMEILIRSPAIGIFQQVCRPCQAGDAHIRPKWQ